MKLIGSTTSPYVRRIRLLLDDSDYEFVNLDIYGQGRDELRRNNPAQLGALLPAVRGHVLEPLAIYWDTRAWCR